MDLRSKTYWIFDLDGTLTVPVHDFRFIRRELAVPETEDILAHLDRLPADEAQKRHARLRGIEEQLARDARPSPGAHEMLETLHRNGAHLGILTRNHRDIALLTLDTIGIRRFFADDHVLGRHEAPPKPDPAGIHHLLSLWGATASDSVMVGDYIHDLQAGRAAGTTTIHVGRPDGMTWLEFTDHAVLSLAEVTYRLSA